MSDKIIILTGCRQCSYCKQPNTDYIGQTAYCDHARAPAQHPYNEKGLINFPQIPKWCPLPDRENVEAIQQARRDTAKEIFSELDGMAAEDGNPLVICFLRHEFEALRAKYLPESKKEGC